MDWSLLSRVSVDGFLRRESERFFLPFLLYCVDGI